jgi:ubiquitin C-terminal hydrolase
MTSYDDYKLGEMPPARPLENYMQCCWLNSLCQLILSLAPFNQLLAKAPQQNNYAMRSAWQRLLVGEDARRLRAEFAKLLAVGQNCVDEALCLFLDALRCAPATHMLRLVLNYNMQCECGWAKKTREEAYRIVVTEPKDLATVLLRNESPLADFACPECKRRVPHRVESLGRVENSLIFVFDQWGPKRTFPFEEMITLPSTNGPPHRFRLVAQIEHFGTRHGGHYYARVLRNTGVMKINDQAISPSKFEPTPYTYMVAYFRCE